MISESQLLIATHNTRMYSRLLHGHFPDYTVFFPKSFNTKGTVLRTDLVQALKRINLISRENNFNTKMSFSAEKGIELSSGDTELGASRIALNASIQGEDSSIGMNSAYLLEALNVMKDEYVSLDFESPLSPVRLLGVPEKNDKSQYRHIIMPLKI